MIYNRGRMSRIRLAAFVAALALSPAIACGPGVDLSTGLEVTDVLTGYYDNGLKDGWNYLMPSISFRLHNKATRQIGPVQVTVAFWQAGEDGEWDSVVVQGIRAGGLAAGATTESLTARGNVGYKMEGARADLFIHSMFKNVTARLFAGQSGAIVPLGQFPLEHTIIPHLNQ